MARGIRFVSIVGPCESIRAAKKRFTEGRKNLVPVLLLNRKFGTAAMIALHARGNCFESLCHSEGWGLDAAQAASAGKPVIITRYGGQLDDLIPEIAYLVDFRLTAVNDPNGWPACSIEPQWAEPAREHASKLMRHVFYHLDEARYMGQLLAARLSSLFDSTAIPGKSITSCNEGNR